MTSEKSKWLEWEVGVVAALFFFIGTAFGACLTPVLGARPVRAEKSESEASLLREAESLRKSSEEGLRLTRELQLEMGRSDAYLRGYRSGFVMGQWTCPARDSDSDFPQLPLEKWKELR